ncbi:TetR family transcriptional regulator C-terminal domain-containing protein [Nocardioides carbamazepini]|uniref:TetR/AcrR family transcriptional regulator n=1 Tax=Nocardioides carbamazepini TaxID=2854259 RepID=UPI00214A78F7|nr:TetR/AcrR family transcriptional regulator [Nocardioides carbamazepini]MCR1782108.1 TetR family transcriptional regulator C-terminal domain-containing protein [Nocardioides carbamazepini]
MPKQVDHRERRESIAHALWTIVDQQGWARATMREVAREAGVSLGQLQHYFSSRAEMLAFAIEFAAERTSQRVAQGMAVLDQPPHPRDVLRVVLVELLPLRPDARATSRVNAAYVLEAMHDPTLHQQVAVGLRDGRAMVERLVRQAVSDGQISPNRDPAIETDLILALTGFAPLLELNVVEPQAALAAIDQHLDRLFGPAS